MEQQTAVDWLVEQLLIYGDKAFNKEISLGQYHIKKQELIAQAKQMEKEQIEKAFFKGHCDGYNAGVSLYSEVEFQSADQYYTKTYTTRLQNETN